MLEKTLEEVLAALRSAWHTYEGTVLRVWFADVAINSRANCGIDAAHMQSVRAGAVETLPGVRCDYASYRDRLDRIARTKATGEAIRRATKAALRAVPEAARVPPAERERLCFGCPRECMAAARGAERQSVCTQSAHSGVDSGVCR